MIQPIPSKQRRVVGRWGRGFLERHCPPSPLPGHQFYLGHLFAGTGPEGPGRRGVPPRRKEEKEGVAAAGEDAAQPPAQSNYQIKLHFLVWRTLYTLP